MSPHVDTRLVHMFDELHAFHELQRNGGRPVYNISEEFQEVPDNVEEYRERFQPWQDPEYAQSRPYEVIWRQLVRWYEFRLWQGSNRRQEEIPSPLSPTQFNTLYYMKGRRCTNEELKFHRIIHWEHLFAQHMHCDFPEHTLAVKRLLERHGFQMPFLLKANPKEQGKLSTWIEYLAFELLCLDLYSTAAAELKVDHDQKWEKLVQSGFLLPLETEASVRTAKAKNERKEHRNTAWEWYNSARSVPTDTLTLGMATAHMGQVEKRNLAISHFIYETEDYVDASAYVARHEKIVQWVRDELPSVVAEITDWQKDGVPGFNLKKRTRDSDAEESVESIFKRQKPDGSRKIAPLSVFGTGRNAASLSQDGQAQGQDESHGDACMEDI
ncbi:hypothetical protein BKA56DRAFT_666268 [Ilyonectria sp. MPI-CAGE-AT-0026]|nr:hypothetical protein BKA56DRAFT_666268 [Ilyonectria sp. MPI-CAGE-AT-0026]